MSSFKKIKLWGGAVALIVGILTLLEMTGTRWWIWRGEHTALAGEVQSHTKWSLERGHRSARKTLYDNRHAQERYRQEGRPVPKWLHDEQVDIEADIKEIENRQNKNARP